MKLKLFFKLYSLNFIQMKVVIKRNQLGKIQFFSSLIKTSHTKFKKVSKKAVLSYFQSPVANKHKIKVESSFLLPSILNYLEEYSIEDILFISQLLLKANHLHESFLLSTFQRIIQEIKCSNPETVSSILNLYACKRFSIYHLNQEVLDYTLKNLDSFTPPQLAKLLNSFARLDIYSTDLLNSSINYILKQDHIEGKVLCSFCYSFSKLGHYNIDLFQYLQSHLLREQEYNHLNICELVIVLMSFQKQGFVADLLTQKINNKIKEKFSQISPKYLYYLLRTCSWSTDSKEIFTIPILTHLPIILSTCHPIEALAIFDALGDLNLMSNLLMDLFLIQMKDNPKLYNSYQNKLVPSLT